MSIRIYIGNLPQGFNSKEFDILNNTGVALLPGSDFGFNPDKMLARLSFTDFDGQEFMKNIDETKKIDENLINKFAPKVVEGVNKLKNWSENL